MKRADNKLMNMVAFLVLMQGHGGILDKSPDYIMEKFERYVGKDTDAWSWGLDSTNMEVLNQWVQRWILNEGNEAV